MTKWVASAARAVDSIQSGDCIWVHGMAATPSLLLAALVERYQDLQGVQLIQLHIENADMVTRPELAGHIRNRCFFASQATRALINQGAADYVPAMLSEIPKLFRSGQQRVDVALIQVSPPDSHGICSLGVSVEATKAACDSAKTIIAHINPCMPRSHGDGFINLKDITVAFEASQPLQEHISTGIGQVQQHIGQHVASLIEDGDCLQMGIGEIPDAVLAQLDDRRHLGIHTEMFSDGVIKLVESGVIDNSRKRNHPGKLVSGFVLGSSALYQFVNDNPEAVLLDIEYVNSIAAISKNPQVCSINSALQIDLTGQICADSIGSQIYSGVGGQLDFVLGAAHSERGKSIIALPSTAAGGKLSRITPCLKLGSGVVTPRARAHYVVTEYGIANLYGCSIHERIKALISIAHPDHQEQLCREARDIYAIQL